MTDRVLGKSLTRHQALLSWLFQVLAAAIMTQTLYYKFTGAEESVEIFTKIGMEPWGRIGVGVLELVASVCLVIPPVIWLGALLGLGLMGGALFFHATVLGVSVMEDHGYLFLLALLVFGSSLLVLYLRRAEIPVVNKWIPTRFR